MSKSDIDPIDGGDDTPLAPPPSGAAKEPDRGEAPAPDAPPAPVQEEAPLAGDDGPIPQPIAPQKPSVWRDDLEQRGFKKDGFSDDDDAFIEEAKRNGWTPPDNFKGNPEGYVGPKRFVEQGRKSPAAVRRENADMERQISEMNERQKQMLSQQQADRARAIQQGYKRAMDDITSRKQKAWQSGDAEAMARADQDMQTLISRKTHYDANEQFKQQQDQQQANEVPEFITKWQSENAWYGPQGDAQKTAYADSLVEFYSGQGYTQQALLNIVAQDVQAKFGTGIEERPMKDVTPKRETLSLPAHRGFQPPQAGAETPRNNSPEQSTISQYDAGVQEAFGDFFEEHGPSGTGMYDNKGKAEKAFLDMMKGW